MKLVLTVIVFSCTFANAFDVDSVKKFLEKDKTCDLAVYEVAKSKKLRAKLPPLDGVACVGDMTLNAGRITEKTGCAAFIYNMTNGRHYPLNQDLNMVSKKCSSGGFEEVMNDVLESTTDINYKTGEIKVIKSIKVKTRFQQLTPPSKGFRIVVRSTNDSYVNFVGLPKDIDLNTVDSSK